MLTYGWTHHYALILRSSSRERIIYSITERDGHSFHKTTFNGVESTSGIKGLQVTAGKTEQLGQLTSRCAAHDANRSTKWISHHTHTAHRSGWCWGNGVARYRMLTILSDFQTLFHPSGKSEERLTHSLLWMRCLGKKHYLFVLNISWNWY
jgi:hypothetical protein